MASKSIDWDELLLTNDPKKKEIEVSFKKIDGEFNTLSFGDEPGTPGGTIEDEIGAQPPTDDEGDFDPINPGGGGGPIPPLPESNPECLPQDCSAWDDARLDVNVNTTGVVLLRVATDPTFSSCTAWDYDLWNDTGNTNPDQTSVGYKVLHPDGSDSDYCAPYDSTQPNTGFGSTFQPIQDAVGLNNPCITDPNVSGATDRWYPRRFFDTIQGAPDSAMNVMTVELSSNYSTGRQDWPFVAANDYTTTQFFSDYIFLTGNTIGSNNQYRAQSQFGFTSCSSPVPPTDGSTFPYAPATLTLPSALEFRQTTTGNQGQFEIWLYDYDALQYNRIAEDTFMKGGDFLKIETTLIANPYWDCAGGSSADNYVFGDYTMLQTIKNLTTGQSVIARTERTASAGSVNAFFYCIPMHPTCTTAPGILHCFANAGSGVSVWRIAIGGDVTSDNLIERSITNYVAPTYCQRIP